MNIFNYLFWNDNAQKRKNILVNFLGNQKFPSKLLENILK